MPQDWAKFLPPAPSKGREIQSFVPAVGPCAEVGSQEQEEQEEQEEAKWRDPSLSQSVKRILHTHSARAAPPLLHPWSTQRHQGKRSGFGFLEVADVNNEVRDP